MRNFFKDKFTKVRNKLSRNEIAEILDTDEDRIINQYKGYLNYINRVRRELLQKSAEFMGYAKRHTIATHGNQ
jgi:hypothetical protein